MWSKRGAVSLTVLLADTEKVVPCSQVVLGPLHISLVPGLARASGRILWCVHMGNFSPVDQYVIYQTRETVFHRDIKTPRRELKIRRAAEYF